MPYISLSKSGLGFLALLFMFYLSSMQAQSGLLFMVIGIFAAFYFLNIAAAYRSVVKIELGELENLKASEKEAVKTMVEVKNLSPRPLGFLSVASEHGELFKIGAVVGAGAIHCRPEIVFPKRGIYKFNNLRVTSSFPFGLVKIGKTLTQDGEFTVYPQIYPCDPPKAAGFEPMIGGSHQGKHRSLSGNDFHGVRPMLDGEPVKYVHWKSSSKGQGLMLKEFVEELAGKISIIIDVSTEMANNDELYLDWASRVAASIAFAALDRDHHMEIIDLDSLECLVNPVFGDGIAILDKLARLEPKEDSLNSVTLEKALSRISRKSAICLVMIDINSDLESFIEGLMGENRIVSLFLPNTKQNHPVSPDWDVYYYESDRIT